MQTIKKRRFKKRQLMKLNNIINRLFQKGNITNLIRLKIHLRTYLVICLNVKCGLIEWVANTIGSL